MSNQIDFNSDRMIIFYYPAYAGGKFLINCLGLSNSVVFQDEWLARDQIEGNFPADIKINFLKNRFDEINNKWKDMGLGCGQLFALNQSEYHNYTPETASNMPFSTIIKQLIEKNWYFCTVAHGDVELAKYLEFWKNAIIVVFENFTEFIRDRISLIYWNKIKSESWPVVPPESNIQKYLDYNIDNMLHIPDTKYFEMIVDYQKSEDNQKLFLDKFELQKLNNNIVFRWDTSCFQSADKTIKQVNILYQQLGLTDFNTEHINWYYQTWINKLNELKLK
jgi:hypothetical protein